MPWHLSNTIDTEYGKIAYGNAGSGADIVLAHGWPWSSFSWHRVIPELEQHFRVHWFDMPGYGKSSKDPKQPTSLDVQGEVFASMLKTWGLENPTVLAHDFGGAVSLRAHLLHQVDYEQLVLMNVVALSPWGSEFFDHVGKHVDAFQNLPPHIHEAIVKAYIGGALVNELQDDDADQLVGPWLSAEGSKSFYAQFAAADDKYTDEFAPLLSKVRCACSVIWGKDDPWIPVERGKSLSEKITDSSFETLQNVGHLPQLEAPELVLATLEKLLKKTDKIAC